MKNESDVDKNHKNSPRKNGCDIFPLKGWDFAFVTPFNKIVAPGWPTHTSFFDNAISYMTRLLKHPVVKKVGGGRLG